MKLNKVDAILRSVDRLPTLPTIYTKLTRLLQSPSASVKMIGNIIAEDQAIAVKVLRLVNSAFYSLPHKIGSLKHAIVILGLNQIRSLVLATSTLKMFQELKPIHTFDMQKFWEHSVGCAIASRVLAETAYVRSPEDVFAGGLLHDIGKLIHAVYLGEEFAEVMAEVNECGVPMIESEKKVLGYDHTYTGRELALRWNLSQGTVAMIERHHLSDSSVELTKEVAAVYLGNVFAIALGLGSGGEKRVPVAEMEAWSMLKIELSYLESLLAKIERLFTESITVLEM